MKTPKEEFYNPNESGFDSDLIRHESTPDSGPSFEGVTLDLMSQAT